MITVADVMKLPSMYGATILAGHAGMSNPVESVTVLEYGWITNTLDELFSKTEFQGNDLIITSFATIADNVEAQCENIRRYQAMGSVGFILFYTGLILPSVDDRVIACCNELDLVLITMPEDKIIGCGSVVPDENTPEIVAAFLLPEYIGRGYGRKLFEVLESDELCTIAGRVWLTSSVTATPFYEKMGYTYRFGYRNRGGEDNLIEMEKNL